MLDVLDHALPYEASRSCFLNPLCRRECISFQMEVLLLHCCVWLGGKKSGGRRSDKRSALWSALL
jgi:hypothetical protein